MRIAVSIPTLNNIMYLYYVPVVVSGLAVFVCELAPKAFTTQEKFPVWGNDFITKKKKLANISVVLYSSNAIKSHATKNIRVLT